MSGQLHFTVYPEKPTGVHGQDALRIGVVLVTDGTGVTHKVPVKVSGQGWAMLRQMGDGRVAAFLEHARTRLASHHQPLDERELFLGMDDAAAMKAGVEQYIQLKAELAARREDEVNRAATNRLLLDAMMSGDQAKVRAVQLYGSTLGSQPQPEPQAPVKGHVLVYPPEWRFDDLGSPVSAEALGAFGAVIRKIARAAPVPKDVYEVFKSRFGEPTPSTSESWAVTDLENALAREAGSPAEFVDAVWAAITDLAALGVGVPTHNQINAILERHSVPYLINPPALERVHLTGGRIVQPRLEQYAVGERIGGGGSGVVYRAKRRTPYGEFDFAIKILEPRAGVDAAVARLRFAREVEVLSRLSHRAIVPYVDAGNDEQQRPYLVMHFVEGKTVTDAVERGDVDRACLVMEEILGGVVYAHGRNVIHRDIKPRNILLRSSDGQPIILDFGCAYLLDDLAPESLTASGVGSSGYTPSEVLQDPKLRTPLHDVYACGAVLYEMLHSMPPDPADYEPCAPRHPKGDMVNKVIQKAIASKRERYASAAEFLAALKRLREDGDGQ